MEENGGWSENKEGKMMTSLTDTHPWGACIARNRILCIYSISASSVPWPPKCFSLWDHHFLLFQLSLTLLMLFNSTAFLMPHSWTPFIRIFLSSFFLHFWLWNPLIISPGLHQTTLPSASHTPPDVSAGAGFLGGNQCSLTRSPTQKVIDP